MLASKHDLHIWNGLTKMWRWIPRFEHPILAVILALGSIGYMSIATPVRAQVAAVPEPIHHVFVIVLENQAYEFTFGQESLSPYLAHDLTRQGALLTQYYGIGHNSLDNYISLISGQGPNPATQEDCPEFAEFNPSDEKLDANGQLAGQGCIYPAQVRTIADQLRHAGLDWKAYMEGMGSDPSREAARCGHAVIGTHDNTNRETVSDRYADRHNPFIYFHSIIDDRTYCNLHVVPLNALATDLAQVNTTPNLAFITPDLCHDGHDAPCLNGEKGGPVSADAFLRAWVPRIVASQAFQQDGLLMITFDEGTDARACCGERPLPGGPQPGKYGPGGGRIGAVLLSPFIRPGTISHAPYNHYAALRSMEWWFGLSYLGYAGRSELHVFGADIFTQPNKPGQTNSTAGAPH